MASRSRGCGCEGECEVRRSLYQRASRVAEVVQRFEVWLSILAVVIYICVALYLGGVSPA